MTFAEGVGMLVTDICYLFTATKFCWWMTDKFFQFTSWMNTQANTQMLTEPSKYWQRAERIANERRNRGS